MRPHPRHLTASERAIDVWLAFDEEITGAAQVDGLRAVLSESELAQESRFYFAEDRKRHLVTRALVRTVLSRYADIAPRAWQFEITRYGRPEISAPNVAAAGIRFNISHTRRLVALAVTRDRAVGIDVESVRARPAPLDLAHHYFATAEIADLARVRAAEQQQRFFEYWTFKESYIKARGMGMSIPLDQFSFDYPHERGVRLSVYPALGDDARRWRFWQCLPSDEHLLAICAERSGPPPVLTFRKISPTDTEAVIDVPVSRASSLT
jgi:4'-phosphopantetheinyl transferase